MIIIVTLRRHASGNAKHYTDDSKISKATVQNSSHHVRGGSLTEHLSKVCGRVLLAQCTLATSQYGLPLASDDPPGSSPASSVRLPVHLRHQLRKSINFPTLCLALGVLHDSPSERQWITICALVYHKTSQHGPQRPRSAVFPPLVGILCCFKVMRLPISTLALPFAKNVSICHRATSLTGHGRVKSYALRQITGS